MNTLTLKEYGLSELTQKESINITGGGIPWGLIGRAALRVVVGAAGVATGVGIAIGIGLLAYEIFSE